MKRLMTDIEAGKIDCVVVYKVDRISRSLLDFSRVMETFERHNVAFVSVGIRKLVSNFASRYNEFGTVAHGMKKRRVCGQLSCACSKHRGARIH